MKEQKEERDLLRIDIAEVNSKNGTSDSVAEYLKQGIISGEWSPGQKIPSESQLCKLLNVSRVSVRSGINRLSGLGLLESLQGKGTFVRKPDAYTPLNDMFSAVVLSHNDRISMHEFRKTIEVAAAGFAASRATTEMVDNMRLVTEKMKNATELEEIVHYDLEFHRLISLSTENFAFIKSFEVLRDTYVHMLRENVAVLGAFGAVGHGKIISAIEIRNSELAKEYMLGHFDETVIRMNELKNSLE